MFIRTALSSARLAELREVAQDAYRTSTDRAVYSAPRGRTADKMSESMLIGLDDRNQSDSRRRRWAIAYLHALNVFGLPQGAVWIPCYVCGELWDAWTLDADHVDPHGGSHPHNLMLACASCNSHDKASNGQVPLATRELLDGYAVGVPYVMGGPGLRSLWNARPRRKSGGNWSDARRLTD